MLRASSESGTLVRKPDVARRCTCFAKSASLQCGQKLATRGTCGEVCGRSLPRGDITVFTIYNTYNSFSHLFLHSTHVVTLWINASRDRDASLCRIRLQASCRLDTLHLDSREALQASCRLESSHLDSRGALQASRLDSSHLESREALSELHVHRCPIERP